MSRILRTLLCLLLICCILVNCSPIRAKAVVAEAAVISGTGLFATLFAMGMGVVFVDLTTQLINGLGRSLENHLSSTTTEEETEILNVWIEPLKIDLDSGGISQDPSDPEDNGWGALGGLFSLPSELLDNFLSWGKTLINGEGVDVEGEAAPEGYVYLNGHCVPNMNAFTTRPGILSLSSDGVYTFYVLTSSGTTYYFYCRNNLVYSNKNYYKYVLTDGSWGTSESVSVTKSACSFSELVWASKDVNFEDGTLAFAGSEPTSVAQIEVLPDVYVGDIPQQVQDGTFDEEQYELPYINYSQIFQGQTDAVQALNNVATQLQNQTMTYEQYMEQIKTEVDSGGSDGGSGDDSGNTPSGPVPDMLPYALDLTEFFPFCIPFDLYDFFSALIAEPEAPQIHWELRDLSGNTYDIDIDLSAWDSFALVFRRMQLLLFIVGLAAASRKFIKW